MSTRNLLNLFALVFAAVSLIVVGDTAGKLLGARGVDPVFIAWTRLGIAALVLLPFTGFRVSELGAFRDARVLARGALTALGIVCLLTALKTEPIADVFGALFIGPVVSYLLAMVFLGERPSRAQGTLLALSFLGVMLVVQPGFGISPGILFALAAGCCYGTYLALTRGVVGAFRPRLLLISQLIIGAVLLTPLGLTITLPVMEAGLLALVLLSALASAAGNYLLVVANQTAEASLIAPLVYSQLITATVLGVLVFGDWPDGVALSGLCLILASGVGSLWVARLSAPRLGHR